MPGFLDKVKEGAQKAAAEADRLSRQTQAQLEVRSLEKQVSDALEALGRSAMELFDRGALPQPELRAACDAVVAARQKLAAQQQRIADIQSGGKTPATPGTAAPAAPAPAAPSSSAAVCPQCGAPVKPGARFCGECGAPVPVSAT
jgi:hypothetical protein